MDVWLGCLNNNEKLFSVFAEPRWHARDPQQSAGWVWKYILPTCASTWGSPKVPSLPGCVLWLAIVLHMCNTRLNNPTESQVLHTGRVVISKDLAIFIWCCWIWDHLWHCLIFKSAFVSVSYLQLGDNQRGKLGLQTSPRHYHRTQSWIVNLCWLVWSSHGKDMKCK